MSPLSFGFAKGQRGAAFADLAVQYGEYFVFEYQFTNGSDLDTRTGFINPPIAAINQTFDVTVTAPSDDHYTISGTDRNSSFTGDDATVTINVNDTINFNLSNVAASHPFYIRDANGGANVSTPAATGQGSTGNSTVSWTPNTAGTYYYQCGNHAGMIGTITVNAENLSTNNLYEGWQKTGNEFLYWGGDNTGTGFETVYIDKNQIMTAYPGTTYIEVDMRAFWYGTYGSNGAVIKCNAYTGGTMVKNGYTWTNPTATYAFPAIYSLSKDITDTDKTGDGERVARVRLDFSNYTLTYHET